MSDIEVLTEFATNLIKQIRTALKKAGYDLDNHIVNISSSTQMCDEQSFDIYLCNMKAATIAYNLFGDEQGLYFERNLDFCSRSGFAQRVKQKKQANSYELAAPIQINIGDPAFISTIRRLIDEMVIPIDEEDKPEEEDINKLDLLAVDGKLPEDN